MKKVAHAPLWASTTTRHIDEIAEGTGAPLLGTINESPCYVIQVDESTGADKKAINACFRAIYIFPEDVHEDRLCALSLPANTTAADLLSTHCVIQRVMLASRKMSPEPNVLHDVIKVMNHKVRALYLHQFEQLCEEMDAEQEHQVRWLSKGRSLARVFELRELLHGSLPEKWSPLAAHFSSTEWVVKNLLICVTYSACSTDSICHFRGECSR